jgi:FtsP/CotA-like multicopper oxidase with cupredoxin domain
MNDRKRLIFLLIAAFAMFALPWGFDGGTAQTQAAVKSDTQQASAGQVPYKYLARGKNRMRLPSLAERKAAAGRMLAARASAMNKAAASGGTVKIMAAPGPGQTPDYFGPYPNYANTQFFVNNGDGTYKGLRKFVNRLPGLTPAGANELGQYIPIAVPDTTTYTTPPCDYYEIALVEYTEKMHSDLPPTRLRGYVQEVSGVPVDNPHYLGPLIIAQKDRPVRIKFTNRLPVGAGGDLFIPVDTTIMGAGAGPQGASAPNYTQNRATIHLHGGNTAWISDGTPHQWITPASETTPYPKGVSVYNVPDMGDPGPGAQTFFYSNQQSARLMFYHDHASGITRLNVYAGEAAGYLLQDPTELKLIADGIIPADQIPLIIQDKTFVPDNTASYTNLVGTFASQLEAQDPTWDTAKWGGPGQLWYPHVYMTLQNPWDPSGFAAMGRWHYSAWFWPPYIPVHPPVANPYYDPVAAPWEPPQIPGTPDISVVAESFFDTPVVNGTAYPYLEVDPKAYRLRILNAANDRFWNLMLFKADIDPAVVSVDGRTLTEVKMVPAVPTPGFPAKWPIDGRESGVPDPATMGPPFIQIGHEGGFLPAPVEIFAQPIDWNMDAGTFDFGNVNTYSLFLGPAERADVIVDFTDFAGQTLILYNDSIAPVPASDPRYDIYTNGPDMTDIGGPSTTPIGWGPNTRTIMQIRVKPTGAGAHFSLAALNAAFASTDATLGVFAASQKKIIVPQHFYNSAYNATFPAEPDAYAKIFDSSLTFTPIGGSVPVTLYMEPKAIHDEMGGAFDKEYGRLGGKLGLEIPQVQPPRQTTLLYDYIHPPTELIVPSFYGTPIGVLGDGTQIWRITHNGVDTHPMHFHVFEVQLINRVAWDNSIRPPDLNELGWKDTVRFNPLQDTIVALRPIAPNNHPYKLPNSVRPLAPQLPIGAPLGTVPDPLGNPVAVVNHLVNLGWEYVWHCHILAHEENDLMHAIAIGVPPEAPSNLVAVLTGNGRNKSALLTWLDNSLNETEFNIDRATDPAFIGGVTTFVLGPDVTTYSDIIGNTNQTYYYRVSAGNTIGDLGTPGFPARTVVSAYSNTAGVNLPPAAPTNVQVLAINFNNNSDRVTTTWTDASNNETGFEIQWATDANFTVGVTTHTVKADVTTHTTGNLPKGATFYFRVRATNASGVSAWVNAVPFPIITP